VKLEDCASKLTVSYLKMQCRFYVNKINFFHYDSRALASDISLIFLSINEQFLLIFVQNGQESHACYKRESVVRKR